MLGKKKKTTKKTTKKAKVGEKILAEAKALFEKLNSRPMREGEVIPQDLIDKVSK